MTESVVERSVRVPAPLDRAFERFAGEMQAWWPPEYTWAGEKLERIGIEPGVGGLCYELGPHGFRCDWGRVLAWDPPHRLVLSWQINPDRTPEPDPARASEVEVLFDREAPETTHVRLVHTGFERHAAGGGDLLAGMASPGGWSYLLRCYVASFG